VKASTYQPQQPSHRYPHIPLETRPGSSGSGSSSTIDLTEEQGAEPDLGSRPAQVKQGQNLAETENR
jgi:hypothetical protein